MTTTTPPPACLVLTTLGASADAAALARTLVEERLAACVSVLGGVTSVYRWKDAVEQEAEQQLIIKTTPNLVPALETRLRTIHPYEVPEFLVLDVSDGSDAYLAWLRDSLT